MDDGQRQGGVSSGGIDSERGYSWSEDEGTVEVSVSIPAELTGKRDLVVKITNKKLVVRSAKAGCNWVLEIELYRSVSPDESTWTYADGTVEVSMEKSSSLIWGRLLT